VFNGAGSTNEDKVQLYRNGELMTLAFTGTIPSSIDGSDETFYIGRHASNYFEGQMDEFILWDGVKDAGYALESYQRAAGEYYPQISSLQKMIFNNAVHFGGAF